MEEDTLRRIVREETRFELERQRFRENLEEQLRECAMTPMSQWESGLYEQRDILTRTRNRAAEYELDDLKHKLDLFLEDVEDKIDRLEERRKEAGVVEQQEIEEQLRGPIRTLSISRRPANDPEVAEIRARIRDGDPNQCVVCGQKFSGLWRYLLHTLFGHGRDLRQKATKAHELEQQNTGTKGDNAE